ncbi:putative inhibitor of dGTPase [Erwinia phage pEp_SNUABM_12]|uniref:Putative inhibitor of dGTPase n=1 Tax=Erwinia phage pEp_SNUABM_12 TaxID=2772019 RepID=A0A7L7SMZ9_9CAUD|nr:putative inhibitor of dGTPase [Erwinia phage pEp_SNUABM_12]
MGRISHCNIIAYHKARERVTNCAASVITERWFDQALRRDVEALIVTVNSQPIVKRAFSDYDEEVLINSQTSWLNKVADELDYWQSKS